MWDSINEEPQGLATQGVFILGKMRLIDDEKLGVLWYDLQVPDGKDRPRHDDHVDVLGGKGGVVALYDVNLGPGAPLLRLSPPVVSHRRWADHYGRNEFFSVSVEASKALDGLSCPRCVGNQDTVIVALDEIHIFSLEWT